jgi:hypothetical protein
MMSRNTVRSLTESLSIKFKVMMTDWLCRHKNGAIVTPEIEKTTPPFPAIRNIVPRFHSVLPATPIRQKPAFPTTPEFPVVTTDPAGDGRWWLQTTSHTKHHEGLARKRSLPHCAAWNPMTAEALGGPEFIR